LEIQLAQAAKLEAIGQLAAGIAHEINTPTQYVGDGVSFLKDSFNDVSRLIDMLEVHLKESDGQVNEEHSDVKKLLEEIEVDFLRVEIPKAFDRIVHGLERISTIVQAMKRFSYSSGDEKKSVNIRNALESTLEISRNAWKYVADVQTEFDPEVTDVVCLPGEMSQVLLNIILNAAHAIEEVVAGTSEKGLITIKTHRIDDAVDISIQDTGSGIPENVRDKVFNLFFTTKEVGKGTGQGLALAFDVIVNKHGGAITFDSEVGRGTTFHVRLPING
jgi:signal transduction histidine kinase